MVQLETQSSVPESIPASPPPHNVSLPPTTKGVSVPLTTQASPVPVSNNAAEPSTFGVSAIPSAKTDTVNIVNIIKKTAVVLKIEKLKIQLSEMVACNDELLN